MTSHRESFAEFASPAPLRGQMKRRSGARSGFSPRSGGGRRLSRVELRELSSVSNAPMAAPLTHQVYQHQSLMDSPIVSAPVTSARASTTANTVNDLLLVKSPPAPAVSGSAYSTRRAAGLGSSATPARAASMATSSGAASGTFPAAPMSASVQRTASTSVLIDLFDAPPADLLMSDPFELRPFAAAPVLTPQRAVSQQLATVPFGTAGKPIAGVASLLPPALQASTFLTGSSSSLSSSSSSSLLLKENQHPMTTRSRASGPAVSSAGNLTSLL